MTVNTGKPRQIVYADQVCNDNILINTDYRQGVLVNQRGQLQYTAEWWQPAFDMHKLCGGMAELLPEGVRLTKDTNAEYVMLMTRVESYKIENGKTYCLSMQIDGEIYNTTFTTPLTQTQWMNTPHVAGSIGYDTDAGVYNVTYTIYTGDVNPIIQAAKLEQGTISTLHLEQTDYTETLRKCQYYYYQSWPGNLSDITANIDNALNYVVLGTATDINFINVNLPVKMRNPRTVSVYDLSGEEGKVSKSSWDFLRVPVDVIIHRIMEGSIGLSTPNAASQKGDAYVLFLQISAEL